jgi:multidrug resistance efflux pump
MNQWRRIRFQLFPVLSMASCILLTGWLWHRRIGAISIIGEVQLQQVDAPSQVAGLLVPLPQPKQLALYDYVSAGQTLAMLDDGAAKLALETLQAELGRLQLELPAKEEEMRLDTQRLEQDHASQARRLALDIERLRLDLLDRKALIETDRIDVQRRASIYEMVKLMGPAATKRELLEVELARDVAQERMRGNEKALKEAEEQLAITQKRAADQTVVQSPEIKKVLAPLRAAITVQERRMRELDQQIASLEVRSPIPGRISAIHRYPGQSVRAGDPIVTIVNEQSQYVISYIRQDQRVSPSRNMTVEVRPRFAGGTPIRGASIVQVGPHVESIPLHQLRDPKVPEWGVPLLINLPGGLTLRPGELVEVRLKPSEKGG